VTGDQQRATSIRFLFWLYVLFVIYGIAIPLRPDLTRAGMRHRWKHAERIPFLNSQGQRLSLGDAVGNILLFVPFGLFLHGWRQARRLEIPGAAGDRIGISFSLLVTLLFSGAIECGQLFLDGRVTSVNDVINNLAGAFIGIRLASAHPLLIANTWQALKRIARQRPLWALWLATMAAQTLLALAPFDFTLKMENFQRQWLRWQYSWQALPGAGQISPSQQNFFRQFPHPEQLLVALFITMGCGVLLGAFWVLSCQRYGNRSPHLAWGSALGTFGFYPILSLVQFTVQSVRPLVFFLIAGLGGVTMGALLAFIISQFIARLSAWRES
jgi:glycopeptide antibiotics resistance protein